MHFWINKPAGRNYASGGRRYPTASSASKTRSGGRRGREIGPMVTPVHRFQSLNGPSVPIHSNCSPGPSATNRSHHHHHQHNQQHQHHQQHQHQRQQSESNHPQTQQQLPPTSESLAAHVDEETRNTNEDCGIPVFRTSSTNIVISNNVTNAAAAAAAAAAGGGGVDVNNERPTLPNETMNNGLNRAGFLVFPDINDTELAGCRLRCGVWITFVLATGFVSVAKFCFGNRDAGLDMLIFCGLLFTLLLSGCFYTALFRRAQNNQRHLEQLEQDEQQIATLAAALTIREENAQHAILQLQMQQQQQQQQPPPPPPPPPPPYHIAILIPPPNSPEEAPPPSYDKAMNEDPANHTRVFIFSKEEDN